MGRMLIETPDSRKYNWCAIGMGLAATGNTFHETGKCGGLDQAKIQWPWLEKEVVNPAFRGGEPEEAHHIISCVFIDIMEGRGTLDQLIDWVASVEPADTGVEKVEVRDESVQSASRS